MSVVRPADASPSRSPRVLVSVTARAALGVIVGHVDHLARNGWDVHVLVGETTDVRLLPRATVHVVPMARGRSWRQDLGSYRAVCRTLSRVRPDVVVAATPKAAALTLRAARRVGVSHRVWWVWGFRHENSANVLGRVVELDAGRTATQTITASASLSGVLDRHGVRSRWLGAGSIAGVDLDVFSPASGCSGQDRRTPPTAVVVGRLSRSKGLDHLARIWPQVVARIPTARLLLAGEPDPLDPADVALAQLSRMPGVAILGYTDDVPGLLRRADVLVHPSRREGLPSVVLEAAASAVPAVVWNVTGCCDAVVDGHTGQVVDYGDESTFAASVIRLLGDADARMQMGDSARQRVERLFTRETVEADFSLFLDQLADHAVTANGSVERFAATPSEILLTDPAMKREPAALHAGGSPGRVPDRQG